MNDPTNADYARRDRIQFAQWLFAMVIFAGLLAGPYIWMEQKAKAACQARGGVYTHDQCFNKDALR